MYVGVVHVVKVLCLLHKSHIYVRYASFYVISELAKMYSWSCCCRAGHSSHDKVSFLYVQKYLILQWSLWLYCSHWKKLRKLRYKRIPVELMKLNAAVGNRQWIYNSENPNKLRTKTLNLLFLGLHNLCFSTLFLSGIFMGVMIEISWRFQLN